jgi:hypothetical protein
MMKRKTILVCTATFILLHSSFTIPPARAQLWHALPPISKTAGSSEAQFSNDEKKVFYTTGDGPVKNIWSVLIADKWGGIIAGPKNPPVQITKFTERGVARFFHLLTRPEILYMRATENGKDFHIYRIADDGSGVPQDLTPGPEGVTNEIIGASYNGRYVYYTSNKVNRDKTDVYRYDTQQYTSDIVFPNDKDYKALGWTRDQTKLILEFPETGALSFYDIESTTREPIAMPSNTPVLEALIDPTTQNLIVLQKSGESTIERSHPIGSGEWKDIATGDMTSIDFSVGGKYEIVNAGNKWSVREAAIGAVLPLPEGANPIAIAPKETMMLYTMDTKLYLYDITKKASTELISVQ